MDGPTVCVKVYISPRLHKAILDEVGLCDCTISSFTRAAILHELQSRLKERKAAAKDMPLPGQRSIDGIAD